MVFYADESFEIYDLHFSLKVTIYFTNLMSFGYKLKRFKCVENSKIDYDLYNVYLIFVDERQRLFKFGPIFWPDTLLSLSMMDALKSLQVDSGNFYKLAKYLESFSGRECDFC